MRLQSRGVCQDAAVNSNGFRRPVDKAYMGASEASGDRGVDSGHGNDRQCATEDAARRLACAIRRCRSAPSTATPLRWRLSRMPGEGG